MISEEDNQILIGYEFCRVNSSFVIAVLCQCRYRCDVIIIITIGLRKKATPPAAVVKEVTR